MRQIVPISNTGRRGKLLSQGVATSCKREQAGFILIMISAFVIPSCALSKAKQLLLFTSNGNGTRGPEEDAPGRQTMKDPANTIIKAKLRQEAERTPQVDLLSELPVLMRERCKNRQKDFEFLSSWLL